MLRRRSSPPARRTRTRCFLTLPYPRCGDDPIALTAIQLSLLIEMDERTLSLLRELFGQTAGALTIEIAARIACPGLESIDSIPRLRRAFERAELLLQASPDAPGFLKAPG